MPRSPIQHIESPETWQLLVAPVRAEIVETIRLQGPCSVAEIAATLDRPADTLYRHLAVLEEAGLVVEAGFRKAGRNAERLVDVVADDFAPGFRDPANARENDAIVATATSLAKVAVRAVRDSAAAGQLEFDEQRRNTVINYELSWLTPERFHEVRGLLRRLKQIMDDCKRSREGRLYMTLSIATPVTRRRHAKQTVRDAAPQQPVPKRASKSQGKPAPARSGAKPAAKSSKGRRSR